MATRHVFTQRPLTQFQGGNLGSGRVAEGAPIF